MNGGSVFAGAAVPLRSCTIRVYLDKPLHLMAKAICAPRFGSYLLPWLIEGRYFTVLLQEGRVMQCVMGQ